MAKTLILSLLLIAGCASMKPPIDNPRQIWCDTNSPRRDATETTPRAEIDEINRHNALGVRWCRWVP